MRRCAYCSTSAKLSRRCVDCLLGLLGLRQRGMCCMGANGQAVYRTNLCSDIWDIMTCCSEHLDMPVYHCPIPAAACSITRTLQMYTSVPQRSTVQRHAEACLTSRASAGHCGLLPLVCIPGACSGPLEINGCLGPASWPQGTLSGAPCCL